VVVTVVFILHHQTPPPLISSPSWMGRVSIYCVTHQQQTLHINIKTLWVPLRQGCPTHNNVTVTVTLYSDTSSPRVTMTHTGTTSPHHDHSRWSPNVNTRTRVHTHLPKYVYVSQNTFLFFWPKSAHVKTTRCNKDGPVAETSPPLLFFFFSSRPQIR
jgi:hypothetical protein